MPFNEVKGQNQVIFALSNAIQQNRLSHAYLFAGNEGVGKFKMALKLSQFLLCNQPLPIAFDLNENTGGCGVCSACQRVEKQIHPDFHCIERQYNDKNILEKEIKAEKIREIQQITSLAPFENGNRIIVIKEADRLNNTAANALLKILEEPLPNTFFILITARADSVLPTIMSRCQVIRFVPLPQDLVCDLLEEIINQNQAIDQDQDKIKDKDKDKSRSKAKGKSKGQDQDQDNGQDQDQDLQLLSKLSEGSIGIALAFYEQNITTKINEWLKIMKNDLDLRDLVIKWQFVEKLTKFPEVEFNLWFKFMKTWYRDLLLLKNMKHPYDELSDLITFKDQIEILFEKSKYFELKHICWRIQAIEAIELRIIENPGINKGYLLDYLMLYLSGSDFRTNREMII